MITVKLNIYVCQYNAPAQYFVHCACAICNRSLYCKRLETDLNNSWTANSLLLPSSADPYTSAARVLQVKTSKMVQVDANVWAKIAKCACQHGNKSTYLTFTQELDHSCGFMSGLHGSSLLSSSKTLNLVDAYTLCSVYSNPCSLIVPWYVQWCHVLSAAIYPAPPMSEYQSSSSISRDYQLSTQPPLCQSISVHQRNSDSPGTSQNYQLYTHPPRYQSIQVHQSNSDGPGIYQMSIQPPCHIDELYQVTDLHMFYTMFVPGSLSAHA